MTEEKGACRVCEHQTKYTFRGLGCCDNVDCQKNT